MKKAATFDIEANGFLPDVDTVWCGVIKEHNTGHVFSFSPYYGIGWEEALLNCLENYDVLYGHNHIKYDFPVLHKIFGWEYEGEKRDTLIMSRTQRPNRKGKAPNSVAAWAKRLGLEHKIEHEEWDKFSPEMLYRCEHDVEIQYHIHLALLEEGKGERWELAHRLNNKLFDLLQKQEEHGWLVDQGHISSCLYSLNRWIARIDRAVAPHLPLIVETCETKKDGEYGWVRKPFKKDGSLSRGTLSRLGTDDTSLSYVSGPFSGVVFRPVSLDKNIEVKQFLLDSGWIPDEWNTNNSGEKTSPKLTKDDSFNGVSGSLGKLIARRVQCKHRRGTVEGLKGLIRPDGRIASEVAGIASTGRIKHKGIVNIPSPESGAFFARWMRAIFISQPGWDLVGVDSKGNQIRQLAARMQDEEFTKAVLYGTKEDGTDLHSINQRKSGTPTRTKAKNFFYGFIFGAGDAKIGAIMGKGAKEGKAIKAAYLEGLPGLKKLIETETQHWRDTAQKWWNKKWNRMEYRNGFIRGLDGRPILVDSEHKILVFLLQSDEAIQMAAAYVWFHVQMEKKGHKLGRDWKMLIWYHDEYQFECKPEITKEAASLAEDSVAWAGRFYNINIPHEGEAKVGKNWRDTH